MKIRTGLLMFFLVMMALGCRLSSNGQTSTDLSGGIVPLPPDEDYGVLCFVELGDSIVANAPNFNAFASRDGGLTWQESPAALGSDCNPGKRLQKELWATPNGSVRYRFEVGKSITVSYNQGGSWQLVYDLTEVPWEPVDMPDPEREIVVQPGPLDAMIDHKSGNLLLAMGHAGILVRLPSGEWRWVGAGAYTTTVIPPDTLTLHEDVPEGLILPRFNNFSPEFELDTETNYVDALAFSPDGKRLAASGFSGGVKLFSFPDGELQHWLQWGKGSRNDRLYGAVFSMDGETLCTCGTNVDQTLNFWDVNSWELISQYEGYQTSALSTGRFDGTQYFAIGSGKQVKVFRLPDGKEIATLDSQLEKSRVTRVHFIPDTKMIVIGGAAGGVELWDFYEHKIVFTLQSDRQDDGRKTLYHTVKALGYDPSEGVVLALFGDGWLTAWQISSGELAWQLSLPVTHGWFINTGVFSNDGHQAAVGMHNGTLILFDSQNGQTLTRQWIIDGGTLQHLVFSPDNQWVAAGFTTGKVKVWQVERLINQE